MTSLKSKVARVLSDHRHNVASAEVWSDRGDFSVQILNSRDGKFWNIARSPPPPQSTPPAEFSDVGENFVVLTTEKETAEAITEEYYEMIGAYGGSDAEIHSSKTYHSPYIPSVIVSIKGFVSWIKRKVKI